MKVYSDFFTGRLYESDLSSRNIVKTMESRANILVGEPLALTFEIF